MSGESVKVAVRCRPIFPFEKEKGFKEAVNVDVKTAEISVPDPKNPVFYSKFYIWTSLIVECTT